MSEPTFTERHAENISKLKLILIVVCLCAIPVSFYLNQHDVTSVNNRISRIESPCVRFGSHSKACHHSFGTALKSLNEVLTPQEARIIVCRSNLFTRLRACLEVRRREAADAVHAEPHNAGAHKVPPATGGGGAQQPSSGNQHPAPGNGGSHQGGSGGSGGQAGSPSTPSQPAAPAPPNSSSNSGSSSAGGGGLSEAPPAAPPAEHPVTEGVGHAVEEVGTGVSEVVENVNGIADEVTCGALRLGC